MPLPYQQPGLTIGLATKSDPGLIKSLQQDLRALGYLRAGIDGVFGTGTEKAVRALQYDLLNNTGDSRGDDGRAPVAVTDYNRVNGVTQINGVTGVLDQALAGCIATMLADRNFPQLPSAVDAAAENAEIAKSIAAMRNGIAPSLFMLAIFRQESDVRHFCVPQGNNSDSFILTGFDHQADADDDHITSRGYGVGQYTLFHHPARADEVSDVMRDPVRNVSKAFAELRDKFDRFVAGPLDRADDRSTEHPLLPLRLCKYAASDARYMADCRNCALQANKVDIFPGTPVYKGASTNYRTDQYYPTASYRAVPDRADFPCDWPYAVRRYNGGGLDSYHYQTHVLLNLIA